MQTVGGDFRAEGPNVRIVIEAMFFIREELKEQEAAVKKWRQFWQQQAKSQCTGLKHIQEVEKDVRIRWKRYQCKLEQDEQSDPSKSMKFEMHKISVVSNRCQAKRDK